MAKVLSTVVGPTVAAAGAGVPLPSPRGLGAPVLQAALNDGKKKKKPARPAYGVSPDNVIAGGDTSLGGG